MLPHGPRPTVIPRAIRYVSNAANPSPASQIAARPKGVGAMPRGASGDSGPIAAARAVANEPVTAPAQAGCGPAAGRASRTERRPFARSTAWPTWAANANAMRIVPIGKRIVARTLMSLRRVQVGRPWGAGAGLRNEARGSGSGRAARRRAVGRDDHRPRLHPQAEAAVAARRDRRLSDDVAAGALEEQRRLVDVAALRAGRIDQAVPRAVRLAR